MEHLIEHLKTMEGKDTEGESRAICVLQNESFTEQLDGSAIPYVHDQADSTSAVAYFGLHQGVLVIALTFEDDEDMDYIRFQRVCQDYERNTEDTIEHHLILTLCDANQYIHFITAVILTYVISNRKAEIKFLCRMEDASIYELPEENVQKVIGDL